MIKIKQFLSSRFYRFQPALGNREENQSGQALVEYILMAAILLSIVLAANKLFSNALSGYFRKIAILRSGITGMGP